MRDWAPLSSDEATPKQSGVAVTRGRHGLPFLGNGPAVSELRRDAYDCIMVRIRIGSTEYKCVVRGSAPDGELPSDDRRNPDKGPSRDSSSLRVLRRQGAAKHKLR